MKAQKNGVIVAGLLLICLIIHIYSGNEMRVENGYSNHFFIGFSRFLRTAIGGIPFSIGDFLYGGLIFWILWKLVKYFRIFFRKPAGSRENNLFWGLFYKILVFCCSMYIIFNVFWGINYNRKGIAWQLGLKMDAYNNEDLKEINCLLIDKINTSKRALHKSNTAYPSNKALFIKLSAAYNDVSRKYPFLAYQPTSIKSSMWGWLGNYTGFTGYYNPFTGEAQLNTTVPKFLQPYIACHEVAHQLGYAKEMEANFVGYLAASQSEDPLFHYSVYLDLFTYANRNLFFVDSVSAKLYRNDLDTAVVNDLKAWFVFNIKHQNPVEPVIRWVYGKYLQGNSQPQGILSYDEVTAFIISYYKKFGHI